VSPIRLIILAVAAGAAVVAAFLMRNVMTRVPEPVQAVIENVLPPVEQVPTVNVLVAGRDLLRGEAITEADMTWQEWPEAALSPLFTNERDTPDAMTTLAGSAVRTPIFAGEPIMAQRLVAKGETGYMAALVESGMRAVSIEVSPELASGGFILPEDRVDVIATFEVEPPVGSNLRTATEARIILSNVRVLAIDQTFRQEETGPFAVGSVATLEVSPRDAETLAVAKQAGEITIVLRSFADALRDGETVKSTPQRLLTATGPGGEAMAIRLVRNGETTTISPGGN
jgi:pilus assembly protein CpaB